MKILSQLLVAIKPLQVVGDTNKEITDVINDSRQARPGVMFIAVKGVAVDFVTGTVLEVQFKHQAACREVGHGDIDLLVDAARAEHGGIHLVGTVAGGIFTNLTRDHLDFHKTVDNYIAAKKMFFDALPAGAFALVNADDKVGEVMLQNTRAGKYRYSLRTMADFKGRIVESRLDGTTLELNGNQVEVMFTGRFNAYNLLSVYGAALLLGFDPQEVLVKMSLLVPVAGRFQTLRSPRGYTAIVDYAHTPDALVNVLDTIREVVGTGGHIITVCGCGGDRDSGKRPIMAREAAVRSDRVILTSDNPRTEDPEMILLDMEKGLPDDARPRTLTITDRRQAIRTACQLAQSGDVVLVAGKGHEDYQEIQGVKHHFDDREEVEAVFANENV